jgi:urease accessory protein
LDLPYGRGSGLSAQDEGYGLRRNSLPVLSSGQISAPLPQSVRVDSELRLAVMAGPGRGKIAERRESGALRFRFPRAHGRPPEAILVNVAGGLTGGDRVSMHIDVGSNAALSLTSATAERIYTSNDDPTMLAATLNVADGGTLIWLPQESILHEGARLVRTICVNAESASSFLLADMVYLGRRASGEGFDAGMWKDRWRVSIGGRLVFADETRLTAATLSAQHRAGTLHGAVATASCLVLGAEPERLLAVARQSLDQSVGVDFGATLVDGLVVVRMMALDARQLRSAMMQLAETLLPCLDMPMPRALAS